MALEKEKVLVTSGKKKASVPKETNAVSRMRVTIVRRNTDHNVAKPSEPSDVTRSKCVAQKSDQPCRLFEKYLNAIAL